MVYFTLYALPNFTVFMLLQLHSLYVTLEFSFTEIFLCTVYLLPFLLLRVLLFQRV